MPFISTNDGVNIHYSESGSGKPLILIPGWSCSSRFFLRNVDELSKQCRVIAMDLRGHGESDKPSWGYRISRFAKDVKDLMEALDLSAVTLLGWSMGGSVIWGYLDLFGSERLAKTIFVDQSPKQYFTADWRWGGGCIDAEELAIIQTRLEYDPEGVAGGLVVNCMAKEPAPEAIDFLAGEINKCPGWARSAIMADHTSLDWRDLLPRITTPTLVIVGRKSKVFPWQGSAYVGEQIPNATTVFFEESGHMPFYEEAEKFNETVSDFVVS